ncbi:SpoIIE family protein phosphatase [Streptomyces sp. NBC_01455]|uniref:SpoIIE family protein phosphatase n=1 Tax=Streptomyces sp. NBC_01455 TaxID=2903874 RepID=UPI002E2F36AB|nr:SpoIIE family protein phosphatase [Streptomyces sp. NBC_01455]
MSTSYATERHSSTAAAHRDAEVVIDAHGRIIGWSSEAQDLFGYPAPQILGRTVASVIVSPGREDAASVDATAARAMCGAPIAIRCQDGTTQECRVQVRPAAGAYGQWTVLLTSAASDDVDSALLEALFSESPVGLCVYGNDLRLLRYNPAAEGLERILGKGSLGLQPHELWPDSNARAFEATMRSVIESDVPVTGFDKRGHLPDDPHEHVFANSAFCLHDHAGHVIGLANTSVEITRQRRAEERLALIADASALIGTSLDVMATGQQLADIAVPRLADAAAVDVLAPVIAGDEPNPCNPDLRRIGLQHSGAPAAAANDPNVDYRRYPYPTCATRSLTDPQPHRFQTRLQSGANQRDNETTEGQPAHVLVVPLCARELVLGLVTFYRLDSRNPFEDCEVTIATELASRAALAIDNSRRYTREHNAARALQRELLPQRSPRQSAVETAHHVVSATSGTDWFDIIPISGARVALVVGATGSAGLSGAATMGRLRAAIHTLAELDVSPAELLARLNALVSRMTAEHGGLDGDAAEGTGATCLYAVYDPVSGHLALASAGHPPPIAVYVDGSVHPVAIPPGMPLGTGESPDDTVELAVPPDCTLAFYTPGMLTESRADESLHSFIDLVSATRNTSVEESRQRIVDALLPTEPAQGAVLLLARTRRLDEDQVATWDLPSDPAIVATARSLVQRQLATWGLEDEAFITELVASELVTNAIRYGKTPIRLRLIRDQALICEVYDGSTTAPHLRYARSGDEGGRGLYLVAQFTQRWGTRYTGQGKTIWTEQDLNTSP